MKILLSTIIFLLTLQGTVFAQYVPPDERLPSKVEPRAEPTENLALSPLHNKYFFFLVDLNQPLSNTDWIGAFSLLGIKIGYRKVISDQFSWGIDFGWNTYSEYQPTTTYYGQNSAITSDYFKYLYSIHAVCTGQYYFLGSEGKKILPYGGLGIGVANNEFDLYYNIYNDKDVQWGVLVRPELGVLIPLGKKAGLMGGIHYDYSSTKSKTFDYKNFTNIGFQMGLLLIRR